MANQLVDTLVVRNRKWELRRYSYDGAPLTAHRKAAHSYDDEYEVEVDEAGDLCFSGIEGSSPMVPMEVLVHLIRDGVARGVIKLS